jgi:asparagine synthetase B (glutamine-hydrolysing)
MCGIAGFYRMNPKVPIRDWQITYAANMLEYRGNDATGIALMDTKGKIRVLKNNDPAWKFTAGKEYKRFLAEYLTPDTRIVLVHTRKYTKGSPAKNENNHPMFAGASAIVHNGMIYNDDGLFTVNKGKSGWKRSGETDSDAIRAILDCRGGISKDTIKDMNLLEGVAAVGAIHPATPDKLLLLRDNNPIVIGATRDILMFASDKTTIHKCLKPWVKLHNIWMQVHAPDLSFVPMHNQSGWIIGPNGFEEHEKFEANGSRRGGNTKYTTLYNYHDRREKSLREAEKKPSENTSAAKPLSHSHSSQAVHIPISELGKPSTVYPPQSLLPMFVVCPSNDCNKGLELTDEERSVASIAELACGECGANLSGAIHASFEPMVH